MPKSPKFNATQVRKLAREKFGFQQLRTGQEETIRLILEGRDVLAIMPTGAGKSAIYQICGLLIDGPTVVVSPLIALQKDQKESIEEKDLAPAAVVNASQRVAERREAFAELESGELEFLFVSPEQLANEETREHLLHKKPSLFVVDEAHCVSEWGNDFRPEYGRLGGIIEQLGHPRVLALTATAAPQVREEIVQRLGMREPRVIVWGFDRPNIWLGVEVCPDEETKNRVLLGRVKEMAKPAIVYVGTHRHAEDVSQMLCEGGLRSACYHGGMKKPDRDAVQDGFMADTHEVVVATNAFGMGVDKPNIRAVIHYDIPESLDEYYQEVGRAGRDGEPSRAVLLYREEDVGFRRAQAAGAKLTEADVEKVAEAVVQRHDPVSPRELKESLKEELELSGGKVAAAVARLEQVGLLKVTEDGEVVPTDAEVNLAAAAESAVAEQEAYRQYRLGRVELMRDYALTRQCRRQYLLRYFGEEASEPGGACDNCDTGVAQRAEEQVRKTDAKHPFPLKSRVSHKKFGIGTVMRYEADKIEILFDEAGPKQLVTSFVQKRGLLQSQ